MMSKFKVGDRVRVVVREIFHDRIQVGDEALVEGVTENYLDLLFDGELSQSCYEDHVELIEPDATTTEAWDFDPRRELKVGDRVRATGSCAPTGQVGVFVGLHTDTTICLIEFDDWHDGHDGFGKLKQDSRNGWFVRRDLLELLPPTTSPEPESNLSVRVVADMSQLDGEIDRILRRLKKVEKKARKLGIRLEFRDAA